MNSLISMAIFFLFVMPSSYATNPNITDRRDNCPTAIVTEGREKLHLLRRVFLGKYVVEPPLLSVRHAVSHFRKYPMEPLVEVGMTHTVRIQENLFFQNLPGVTHAREITSSRSVNQSWTKDVFSRVDGKNRYTWDERSRNWILSKMAFIPEPADGLSWEESRIYDIAPVHFTWKYVGDFQAPNNTPVRHFVYALVVTGMADVILIRYFAPATGNFYTVSLNPNEPVTDLDPAVHPAVGLIFRVKGDTQYWVDKQWPGPNTF